MSQSTIKEIQEKILVIIKFIHNFCLKYNIKYCIMGGTALGAVRHKGFIPWDDDMDIFMEPDEYEKFKYYFEREKNDLFYLQEFRVVDEYLHFAKLRLNGTTFIEENFLKYENMHHGIFVDIMILHKVPNNIKIQKKIYKTTKIATICSLLTRNWKPKGFKKKIIAYIFRFLPKKIISRHCYKNMYKYDNLLDNYSYCYWTTKLNFSKGLFNKKMFDELILVPFEDIKLYAPKNVEAYLTQVFGDYMKLPSIEQQKADVHAIYADVNEDYSLFFSEKKDNYAKK